MINLLPPEIKSQTNAARANRLLLRYNVMLLGAIGFLLAAIGLVYVYLGNVKAAAEDTITENIAKAGDYGSVEAEANAFKTDLKNAKQILDNDTAYTQVILEIANVLPPGVALDVLSLDSATFGKPTSLSTNVVDYGTVLRLKDSLQASSIFSDVSIQTISNSGSDPYPLQATFLVTIRKGAAE